MLVPYFVPVCALLAARAVFAISIIMFIFTKVVSMWPNLLYKIRNKSVCVCVFFLFSKIIRFHSFCLGFSYSSKGLAPYVLCGDISFTLDGVVLSRLFELHNRLELYCSMFIVHRRLL